MEQHEIYRHKKAQALSSARSLIEALRFALACERAEKFLRSGILTPEKVCMKAIKLPSAHSRDVIAYP